MKQFKECPEKHEPFVIRFPRSKQIGLCCFNWPYCKGHAECPVHRLARYDTEAQAMKAWNGTEWKKEEA